MKLGWGCNPHPNLDFNSTWNSQPKHKHEVYATHNPNLNFNLTNMAQLDNQFNPQRKLQLEEVGVA